MTRTFATIAIALAALSACDNNDNTIVAGEIYDPQANEVANLENIQLPPSITATHSYRCKDNSLVTIEWLSDDSARVKAGETAESMAFAKAEDGTYSAGDQTLSGAPADQSVNFNGQTCRR